ncbi:MAG: protein kinase [Planctomycetes bacterium]|nr:protein kinase [Planctomycetota bacterium]
MAFLILDKGKDVGKKFKVDAEAILGSDPRVGVPIADSRLAARHARIFRKQNAYFILDLTGTNSVAVNGRVIAGERKLANGDKLRIGLTWFSWSDVPAGPKEKSGVGLDITSEYEIEEELAREAAGDLYKAREIALDRRVALRILPPGLVLENPGVEKRFREEVQSITRLGHENIAKLLDFGVKQSYIYFTTEFIEGTSLETLIGTEGALAVDRALLIARDIARGLDHAHRRNVIHQDLEPRNIVISGDRVVITDFGPTKVIADITSDGMTSLGLVGRLEYCSPESCKGGKVDHRSDIYSLGVIAYQMLTAKLPFQGDSPTDLIEAQISGIPTPIAKWRADVPSEVERIVLKALAKDPKDRFQTCAEFIRAVESGIRDLELIKHAESEHEDTLWAIKWLYKINMAIGALEDTIRNSTLIRIGDIDRDRNFKFVRLLNNFWFRWPVAFGLIGIFLALVFVLAQLLFVILPEWTRPESWMRGLGQLR